MQNLTNSSPSKKKDFKRSTQKNIKETQINLGWINKNIIPISFQSKRQADDNAQNFASQNQKYQIQNSNLSQQFTKFDSRNRTVQNILNPQSKYQEENFILKQASHYSNKIYQDQQNIKNALNKDHDFKQSVNRMQVQIHLTIDKKKYSLRIQDFGRSDQLEKVVEAFLVQNQISHPSKKNYIKTKSSIIQMVEQKLQERRNRKYQNSESQLIHFQKIKDQTMISCDKIHNNKAKQQQQQQQQIFKTKVQKDKQPRRTNNHAKFEKPMFNQKLAHEKQEDYKIQEGFSPNFKTQANANARKSPENRTSNFSPQPMHRQNKYEKLISNYYNDKINDSKFDEQNPIQKLHCRSKQSQFEQAKKQKQFDPITSEQRHLCKEPEDITTPSAKSVYEKWKKIQKSKDQSPSGLHSQNKQFQNAMKNKKHSNILKPNFSDDIKVKQKNWKHPTPKENKQNTRSPFHQTLSQSKSKNKANQQKSLEQRKFISKTPNKVNIRQVPVYESKSPRNLMNKTQCFDKNQKDSKNIFCNKEGNENANSLTPAKHKNDRSSNKFKNSVLSKAYTINDEQYPIEEQLLKELSPDHFYKQGLLFQAKKKLENQEKFKKIYPFTTRALQPDINDNSKRQTEEHASRSKNKYFSTKLGCDKSIALDEKDKSALHERLYQENKQKKMKKAEMEAKQKMIKIAKHPQSQIQINLMRENLKNIKGLSQQNKMILIQRNIEIKQRVREKDKIIDEELNQMIKEGKVKFTYQLVNVPKSPFRKTQVF